MTAKKYSINWEDGEAVSFEVDGVVYESLDQIPDNQDLEKMLAMMTAAEDAEFEQKQAASPKSSFSPENTILLIFTGLAVLMLLIAAFSSFSAISALSKEKSAPGQVVDVVVKREYINEQDRIIREYYYPVVEYTAQDGRLRTVQTSVGSDPPQYEKGNQVTVLYDPQHPLDVRIKDIGSAMLIWILPGITGLLGIAFLGAVLLVRQVITKESSEAN